MCALASLAALSYHHHCSCYYLISVPPCYIILASVFFSSENAKAWAAGLLKILNRDEKYALITYQQLVGVCLYLFVRPEHADKVRQKLRQAYLTYLLVDVLALD